MVVELIIHAYKCGLYEELKKESKESIKSTKEMLITLVKDENAHFKSHNLFKELFTEPSKLAVLYEKIDEMFFIDIIDDALRKHRK